VEGEIVIFRDHTDQHIIDLIKHDHPDWVEKDGVCLHCGAETGFTSLSSMDAWIVEGDKSWSVDKGVLAGGGKGGWLRSAREYENLVWRLEYRVMKEGGNSGMFVRATRDGNPAFTGMEIQILADAGKPADVHSSASLYGSVAPSKNTAKPAGEWNVVEIVCDRRRLRATVNGEQVLNVDLDDKKLPHQEKPLHERAAKGFLGLQDHGDRVEFRNLRIKEIK
jgi:hypothetical protein